MRSSLSLLILLLTCPAEAFFFAEIAPLLQLVTGQVTEIEKLTETIGISREQTQILRELNEGVDKAVTQIQNLQSLIERAQGLDPTAVKSLSDLNDLLRRANNVKETIDEMTEARLGLAEQAISSSALQGDTAYKMGQEMVVAGSQLAVESQTASPGRANQITAAADSAQMLAQGVELQTLAQMVQLQALTLEFQRNEVARDLESSRQRKSLFEYELSQSEPRSKKRKKAK